MVLSVERIQRENLFRLELYQEKVPMIPKKYKINAVSTHVRRRNELYIKLLIILTLEYTAEK